MTIGEVVHGIQPIIDAVPYILVGLSLFLYALAHLVSAYARWDKATNIWDERAAKLDAIAHKTSQAIDWLVDAGAKKWTGAEKAKELNDRLKEAEKDIEEGRYVEALSKATGFYQAAKGKVEKAAATALPFQPRPSIVTSPAASVSSQGQGEIGPDSPAVES